jgi:antitoxin HicB
MWDYPVTLERDSDGSILVSFPDVPEAHTFGADADEAMLRAVDALETALAAYVEDGKDLPAPRRPRRGQHAVRPSALVALKLGIYQAMRDEGIRKAELARRLGWHLPQVDRLLDLDHASRLDQVEAAIAALGRRLDVRMAG